MKNDSLDIHRRIRKPNANINANKENLPDSPDTSSTENMSTSAENVSGKTASAEELPAGQEPSQAYGGHPYTPSSNIHVQDGHVGEPDPACTYGTGTRNGPDGIVCEPGPAYNYGTGARKQTDGEAPGRLLTLEDYLALPDDRRVELIDGVIYDMAAPTRTHQILAQEIWQVLRNCIRKEKAGCEAIIAPYDIHLDKHTVVQPDVSVFCDDDPAAREIRASHAPDLVIEVLSPSTASRDRFLKLR